LCRFVRVKVRLKSSGRACVTPHCLRRLLLHLRPVIAWSSKFFALHTHTQSVRYRLDIMETRSRTRVRARSSPPREVTEGGTQPVSDEFVGQPSSAIGLSGDGKVSSRSTSVEAGPRSVSRPVVCSESVGQERGPAQGAENKKNRGFVGTECSDVISISTTDVLLQLSYDKVCTKMCNS